MGSFLSFSGKKCEDDLSIQYFEEKRQYKRDLTELLNLVSDKKLSQLDKIIYMVKNDPICLNDHDGYGNSALHRIIPNRRAYLDGT